MMNVLKMSLPVVMMAAFTTAAMPQGQGNSQSFPENQINAVRERCAELQAQQGTTGSQEPETTRPERNTDQPGGDGNREQGSMTYDVTTVTLQDCIDGGLLEEKPEQ